MEPIFKRKFGTRATFLTLLGAVTTLSWHAAMAATVNISPGMSTSAIQQAILNANSHDEIHFAAGTYNITGLGAGDILADLDGKSNITIKGNASTILIDDNHSVVFNMRNSNTITVQDLTVRRSTRPYSQGDVTSVSPSNKTITVSLASSFAKFDESYFIGQLEGNFTHSTEKKRLKRETLQAYEAVGTPSCTSSSCTIEFDDEEAGPALAQSLQNVSVGDGFIWRMKTTGYLFHLNDSDNITIKDVTAMDAPAVLVRGRHNGKVTVERLHAQPYETGWAASNAGGVVLAGSSDAVSVTYSDFDAIGDDAINVFGTHRAIQQKVDDLHFEVVRRDPLHPQAPVPLAIGDEISILDAANGKLIATRLITSIQQTGCGSGTCKWDRIGVNIAIPDALPLTTSVFNEGYLNPNFRFGRNTITFGRRNGIIVQGSNGIIWRNTIRDMGAGGIYAGSTANYSKGGYLLRDTVIHTNIIRDTSLSVTNQPAAITVGTHRQGGVAAQSKVNQNNIIRDNLIWDYDGVGISLRAGRYVDVWDNSFAGSVPFTETTGNYVFSLERTNDVAFVGNDASGDTRANLNLCLDIDAISTYTPLGGTSHDICAVTIP